MVKFPSDGFAPDWFDFDGIDFCSAKLAAALDQPPDVVQYLPIDLDCDNPETRAKNYRAFHLLAYQPAMDLHRSDYVFSPQRGLDTSATYFSMSSVEKFFLINGFAPQTELFYIEEDAATRILATDALAARVLKAGCKGVEFRHLADPDYAGGAGYTVRTIRGTKRRV